MHQWESATGGCIMGKRRNRSGHIRVMVVPKYGHSVVLCANKERRNNEWGLLRDYQSAGRSPVGMAIRCLKETLGLEANPGRFERLYNDCLGNTALHIFSIELTDREFQGMANGQALLPVRVQLFNRRALGRGEVPLDQATRTAIGEF